MSVVQAFGGDIDMLGNKILNMTINDAIANNQPVTLSQLLTKIADLVDSSPTTLNTLNELANALGDDPNFATTITALIGTKAPIANPNLTGDTVFGVATTAVADTSISNNQCNTWLNESTNVLTFRVRKSDGTYLTKTL